MFDVRRVPGLSIDEGALVCEHCELTYKKFRTGLTYKEVRDMYWVNDPNSETWKYKRRNTVLGKWKELKGNMWIEHLYFCASLALAGDKEA